MVKLTNAFLRRVHSASIRHHELQRELGEAMTERYGCTHSDVDCDQLIDVLDMGGGETPTVADCDLAMAECGVAALNEQPRPSESGHG